MKKIISMMVAFGLVTSQIGCAGKVTKISAPLDQVQFEKDYKYTVKLKTGKQFKDLSSDQIKQKPDQLIIESKKEQQSLMNKDINLIKGVSNHTEGTQAVRGMLIGAVAVGVPLAALVAIAMGSTDCDDCNNGALPILEVFGIGAGIGGLFGLVIGATIPKHNAVQITPVITPTTSGVDAGVNVGVKF